MLKIRLDRTGVRNKPFYRVVVVDAKKKIGGKPLEIIGYWHPGKESKKIDKTKLNEWVKKGAIITKAVSTLISNE